IGNIFEGRVKELLLIGAVRAPVCTVHFDALFGQASSKGVVAMGTALVSEVIRRAKRRHDQHRDDYFAEERRVSLGWLLSLRFFCLSFSSLLRHEISYTTTRSAEGSTSSFSRCKVRASPSTITSTGCSNWNSICFTAFRSAKGCLTCV